MGKSIRMKAALLSFVMLLVLLMVWQVASLPGKQAATSAMDEEYALLMGQTVSGETKEVNGMPTPAQFAGLAWKQLSDPFYDNGPNDKGIGIQLAHSLGRVGLGYLIAALVAIPLGFVIGMSPLLYKAFDPFIQVLKPISPLAWMPIALYTIKDSTTSAIFVIFICSVWPMLINTAFGVAGVRKDWLNVARTLEVGPLRKAFQVILPAAAPTIITGMRISMGIAWLVIVAAEMLIGGTGIGYFVWNEWNNLSLGNVIFAVLMIGVIGMLLDLLFASLQKKVTYVE
ncbi:nitrate ABC transporter permease [Stutzerimonas stutzeri]|jgi:nitrate/nitrite transport system permease protein|uniref:nitrate ABC transporter permease n=1 Tax=Stutzerimonas stutzeri group TaxID=136846 RepID=UPI000627A607|nr:MULTISPECIES: nitrate ABC transporter permease [Stutzerimonas stutzeri group]KKJ93693.1 nitrate ABC transporter permease [Stutzerimonas stutzeri]KZX60085.1 nitrate ABC transporter, permease protein [Stutzerimonas frequens]MBD3876046.1 nitrate ABC transporter permease [Stutzerimonas kunmingensis]NCT81185.1 nitrate ABC transporter permease [Stutzerimonas stutzeri]|tara:strand:- start:2778 stop:3632 length:855 start_codon:yes stop_codon:yes gene_type:complete